jgi:hypothetical protein
MQEAKFRVRGPSSSSDTQCHDSSKGVTLDAMTAEAMTRNADISNKN